MYGTYAQKLLDGRYEYGRLKEQNEYLGGYYGQVGIYREYKLLPPIKIPYGTVESYDTATQWMKIIEK